jgi:uncharacterized protein YbjT (DUF2867 family)
MKIAVVGATGRTGQQVVEQALARGDDVIAVARHPETLPQGGPGMISAVADVLDRAALAGALAGADAVVSAAGIGASRQPTAVYSEGTANILRAMDAHGISKLAVISAVPAGPRAEQPFLQRHVSIPILSAFSVLPTMTCAGWRRSCAAALRTEYACAPHGSSARRQRAGTA